MSRRDRLTIHQLREVGAGAFFQPRDAAELGLSYYELQKLVDVGVVEHVARGLYRLSSVEPTELYSVAAICAQVRNGTVCLLSALQVHKIGTQLPRQVWIAIPNKARRPRLLEFPVRFVRFSGAPAVYGVEEVTIEGVPARITSVARTVVDCFRYRRLISREAALEALQEALQERHTTPEALWRAAEVCGAKSLIGPPMEVLSI